MYRVIRNDGLTARRSNSLVHAVKGYIQSQRLDPTKTTIIYREGNLSVRFEDGSQLCHFIPNRFEVQNLRDQVLRMKSVEACEV